MIRSLLLALVPLAALLPSPALPQEAPRPATFEIYGFAQVDLIEDFKRVNPSWNATLRPTQIPTISNLYGENGEAILSARQSRLGVQGSLPAGEYDLGARIEVDFFGLGQGQPDARGQNTLRLRQAYGSWGPLLGGLTNSLFMDATFWPTIIDYWGPGGMAYSMNVQIRYTPIQGKHTVAVAVERPGTDLDPTNGPTWTTTATPRTQLAPRALLPDLTAQYRYTDDWGYIQVSGLLRWLGYDTPGSAEPFTGYAAGWGINASAQVRLIPDRLKLLVAVVGGAGISSYMNDATPDLAFTSTWQPYAVPVLGVTAYLDIQWSKLFCSAVGYSQARMWNGELQGPYAFQSGQYASANLLVTPVRNLMAGPELLWGERIDKGGTSGTDIRLQVSVKYSFSSLDFWKPN